MVEGSILGELTRNGNVQGAQRIICTMVPAKYFKPRQEEPVDNSGRSKKMNTPNARL